MRRIARMLQAVAVMAALIAGVPWALVRFVGRPIPRTWPHVGAVVDSIQRSGVDPRTVAKVLACVIWLAWARLVLALALEVIAAVRRRPAPVVRGLGSAQRWAASLVATTSVALSLLGAGRPVGALGTVSTPAPALAWSGGSLVSDGSELLPTAAPAPPTTTWSVQRNDSWWRIAERTTGDGLRWRDVLAANLGREVAPGVVLSSEDQALQPGWSVLVPGTAPSAPVPPAAPDAAPTMTVTVQAGDSLSGIAADRLGDADRWPEIWELNHGLAFPDGRTFADPDLVRPGWVLTIPASPPVEVAATDTPDVQTFVTRSIEPPTTALPPSPVVPPTAAPDCVAPAPEFSSEDDDGGARPLGIGAATLAASLGLGVVEARRRRRLRAAPRGTTVPEPAEALITFEETIRTCSADEVVTRLDLAVRSAVAATAERGLQGVVPAPLVVALTQPDGRIELIFDGHPPTPAAPFTSIDGGWVLDARVGTTSIPAGPRYASFPCPTLVQLGVSGGSDVWIDLEAVGLLVVEGSRRHAREVVQHLAATLSLAPFGVAAHLVAASIDPAAFGAAPVQLVDDLDTALEVAAEHLTSVLGVLRPGTTTAALRSSSAGEPWEPLVAFVGADAIVGPAAADLAAVGATPGRGAAVVTDCPSLRSRWRLRQLDRCWRLDPVGIELRPIGLARTEVQLLSAWLADADRPVVAAAPNPDVVAPEPWSLIVHSYGRPRVMTADGAEVAFTRAKALELTIWLARHRRAGTRAGARGALWDSEVANGTFANVVSDARNSLAAAVPPAADAWIGRTTGERLSLAPGVVCDVELIQHAVESARRQDPVTARRTLHDALALVSGPPFSTATYVWPDAEGFVSSDTLLATTAAAELAELCLAANDLDGVVEATGIGLSVLPGHEELLALRMRAYAARGDQAAVRSEWESYERLVAGDPFGDAEPAPRLVQLRNDLLGRRP